MELSSSLEVLPKALQWDGLVAVTGYPEVAAEMAVVATPMLESCFLAESLYADVLVAPSPYSSRRWHLNLHCPDYDFGVAERSSALGDGPTNQNL